MPRTLRRGSLPCSSTAGFSGEADAGYPPGVRQIFPGGRSDNFANFEGRIDEVAIYDRALSTGEVARHYGPHAREDELDLGPGGTRVPGAACLPLIGQGGQAAHGTRPVNSIWTDHWGRVPCPPSRRHVA